jgi:chemotaxis protein methyltransferase CheR
LVVDREFNILKGVIKEKIGFFPERYKHRPFKRRIAVRMRRRKIDSYLDYARLLEKSEKEQNLLQKALTVNVSKFFRNCETFRKIEKKVLEKMIQENRRRGGMIKIWCGGCATGEESYTIAMLMDRFLRMRNYLSNFMVIGSDIDEDSLEIARAGCYDKKSLDETPDYFVNNYFKKDDNYCVLNELKDRVKFLKLDIEKENCDLSGLDLILFRNVLIYMERDFQEKILMKIYNRLHDRGFLVLGKVETLIGESKSLFNVVDSRERIYRKCRIVKR